MIQDKKEDSDHDREKLALTGREDNVKPDTPMFEDLLDDLGSFGHWQRVIFVLISVADIFGAWAILLPVFSAATPQWSCIQFVNKSNGEIFNSSDLTLNTTEYVCNTDDETLKCQKFHFADEFTSIVTEWDLVCDESYVGGTITSIQMAGVILGAFGFGQLSDLIGRKISYYVAHMMICLGGFACSFAESWHVYAAFRVIVGTGFGGTMVVNSVYTVEFVGKKWRTLCGTVGFWGIGGMSLALLAYLVREWRYLSMTVSLIGILYLVTWMFIPESPRWLCQKGRFDEAEKILNRIAQNNNKPPPSLQTLKSHIKSEEMAEAREAKYTYFHLVKKWKYRKRTMILLCIWFVVFAIYYQLSFNMSNLSGDRYFNQFLAGFVDMAGMLSVILFNNTLGRRLTMTLFLATTCICNLGMLITWLSGNVIGEVILAFALIGKASALSGTYVAQIFTAELYPTVIRNIAMGAGSVTARVATVIAPQIVFLGTYYRIAPYIFCMCISALVTPLCFLLPETTGKPLLDSYD